MLNKVMLIGRLGRDPELKYASSGMAIANLNMATDESYTDRDGNRVERTEWHRVVVFQRVAENCAKYLSKGSMVYVEGSLQTRKWQDQQGQDRYSTEIKASRVQFLESKGSRQGGGEYGGDPSQRDGGYDDPYPGDAYQQQGGGRTSVKSKSSNNDLGPAFPSEASGMDDVPF